MARDNIKLMDSKTFLKDPVAFGFLMDFQYGDAEKSKKAEELLFSNSVDGVAVRNMEELGIVLPELEFWVEMSRKWQEKQNVLLRLYSNHGINSRIAAKYLEETGFKFEIIPLSKDCLSVHDTMTALPVLVELERGYPYGSLSGIKNFIRYEILRNHGIEDFYDYSNKGKLEFFCGWDYSVKPPKNFRVVNCFNSKGKRVYTGDIKKAPHPVKKLIDDYDYKSWHEVGSWEVGNWQELLSLRDENKRVINLETRTILFPDDIEILKQGKPVTIHEVRHFMQVTYEAYFKDNEKLYRLYADMMD